MTNKILAVVAVIFGVLMVTGQFMLFYAIMHAPHVVPGPGPGPSPPIRTPDPVLLKTGQDLDQGFHEALASAFESARSASWNTSNGSANAVLKAFNSACDRASAPLGQEMDRRFGPGSDTPLDSGKEQDIRQAFADIAAGIRKGVKP